MLWLSAEIHDCAVRWLMSDAVISLFSGAGGLSLGFAEAGLKPCFALDIEPSACATYSRNLALESHCADLVADFSTVERTLRQWPRPFAIIGGPPCQGFTSAGLKQADDPRNKLIFAYFEIVASIRPRWFLFENVEGLLTANGGKSISELVRQFISLGYVVRLQKVNFAVYGVPQSRKRVVIVGNNVGQNFDLPRPVFSFNAGKHRHNNGLPPGPTLGEALAGLGPAGNRSQDLADYRSRSPESEYDGLMRIGNDAANVSLHYCKVKEKDRITYGHLRPGQTMKDLPEEFWSPSFKRRAFRRVMDGTPTEKRGGAPSGLKRLESNLSSLTITSAATREFIHPDDDRPLTLREAARLQSFPDRVQFNGNEAQIATQIGNAFPPIAARTFARQLAAIEGAAGGDVHANESIHSGRLIGYVLTESDGKSPALEHTDAMLKNLASEQIPLPLE
jgi:DNA (cytosine-5)-methyltransferase 1